MLFNSFTFIVFVSITFFIYYLPYSRNFQVPILVIASFVFYGWESPKLLILLLVSIILNAITSFNVAQSLSRGKKLAWAFFGVTTNLLILGLFKYAALLTNLWINIFDISYQPEDRLISLLLHLPLPVGISFYTFQGISLVVDVLHQQDISPELSRSNDISDSQQKINWMAYIFKTAFFISFFTQLVAGPIVKAKNFYPQIMTKYFRDIPWNIVFRSVLLGYFLKMVIADNLKDYTYFINYYKGLGGSTGIILLFGYSMQIFADFAGYSLIAIGTAAAFGYTLSPNFNFPYISRSLSEFWRRWHISLSTWLKEYLYIPLGGNRKGKLRTYLNLIIVMTLGGLWHGASWNYAVWGIFHGCGLAVERLIGETQKSSFDSASSKGKYLQVIWNVFQWFVVFGFVSLGWLFFNLSFSQSVEFIVTMIRNISVQPDLRLVIPVIIFSLPVVVYHAVYQISSCQPELRQGFSRLFNRIFKWGQDFAWAIMLALIFLNSGSSNAFIYFQF